MSTPFSFSSIAARGGSVAAVSTSSLGSKKRTLPTTNSSSSVPRAGSLLASALSLLPTAAAAAAPPIQSIVRSGVSVAKTKIAVASAVAARRLQASATTTVSSSGGSGGVLLLQLPRALTRALDALLPLRTELTLARAIILKNANQHRRTLYFRSFRRLCTVAARCIAMIDGVVIAVVAARRDGAPTAQSLTTLAQTMRSTERVALTLASTSAAPQRGAGFASLAVVLSASAAVLWAGMSEATKAIEEEHFSAEGGRAV